MLGLLHTVPTCCYGEKLPREGAKTPLLLLEGETNAKIMLSLTRMQAGNEQGHWDLVNLSAVLVWGLWLAPLDAGGPHWKL